MLSLVTAPEVQEALSDGARAGGPVAAFLIFVAAMAALIFVVAVARTLLAPAPAPDRSSTRR